MRQLNGQWNGSVSFVDVIVRQAHPGPSVREYQSFAGKLIDAERYVADENITWTVLADDLNGTYHRKYGGLNDPSFVIDRDGRVAFYCMFTHAPTLHRALEALERQGGSGIVLDGYDRRPHVLAAMVDGWKGLRRGFPQSALDMERALPGSAVLPFLAHQIRALLAPVALRGTPAPAVMRVGLVLAFAALVFGGISAWKKRDA